MGVPKEEFVIKKMKYGAGVLENASHMLAQFDDSNPLTKRAMEELLHECQEINQFVIEMVLFIKACQTAQKVG